MKKACTVFWLTAALSAQTFVVDGSNGPGAQFTDIQSAIDNVPDGAVLLIRSGSYSGFQLDGRAMTLLGDPGMEVTGHALVANTAAHQTVALRGMNFTGTALSWQGNIALELSNCAGPVWLESLTSLPFYCNTMFGNCLDGQGLKASNCQQLQLRACTVRWSHFTDCATHLASCVMSGFSGSSASPGAWPGLIVSSGSMQISGATSITGGSGYNGWTLSTLGRPALIAGSGADIRVLDGSLTSGTSGGPFPPPPPIDLQSAATIEIAPRVSLWPSSSQVRTPLPNLDSSSVAIGSASFASVTTEPGDLVILVFGLPGAPTVVPGVSEPLWINSSAYLFHTLAVQQGTSPVTGSVAVPNDPLFRGFSIAWQAVVSSPGMPLQVSNPSVNLIR